MVGVAQLVEHLVVVQVAAGSSPVTHPNIRGCAFTRMAQPRIFSPRPEALHAISALPTTSAVRSSPDLEAFTHVRFVLFSDELAQIFTEALTG